MKPEPARASRAALSGFELTTEVITVDKIKVKGSGPDLPTAGGMSGMY